MKYLSICIHDNDFWTELESVANLLIDSHGEKIKQGFDITELFKTRVCEIIYLCCRARIMTINIFESNIDNGYDSSGYLEYFLKHIKIEWTEVAEWDNGETILIDRYDLKTTIV